MRVLVLVLWVWILGALVTWRSRPRGRIIDIQGLHLKFYYPNDDRQIDDRAGNEFTIDGHVPMVYCAQSLRIHSATVSTL